MMADERDTLQSTPKPVAAAIPVREPDAHVMPKQFLPGGGKVTAVSAARSKRLLLWLLIVLGILVLSGAALLYLKSIDRLPWSSPTNGTNAPVGQANANVSNTNAANGNANTNASATLTFTGSLLDTVTQNPVATATLTMPDGALPITVKSVVITALSPTLGAYATSTKYVPLGAVYVVSPGSLSLSKSGTIVLTYRDSDLITSSLTAQEKDLTIATWDGTEWQPMNSIDDAARNTVTAQVTSLAADGIAIVAPLPPASVNTNSANVNTSTISGTVRPSTDADGDGLTNEEETLFGTDGAKRDSDGDGYGDGQEVAALYNPGGMGQLEGTTTVTRYTNPTYGYSLLIPRGWTVGSLSDDAILTFTTITGEFVQVSIQQNPERSSAREWYQTLNPSVASTALTDIAAGGLTGIMGPDRLNVYLADANFIYQVTYNIGVRTEANFLTTFQMMYASFVPKPAVATTNGNTNAATNTNSSS